MGLLQDDAIALRASATTNGRARRPLEGKVALVTGASRGIGRAIAVELAGAGARVGLNNRGGDISGLLDEIASLETVAIHVGGDVSVAGDARAAVRRVVEEWGRLDILVNNAGITRDKTLRKLSDEDWLAVISTNLNSVFYCTSAAIPTMIEQNYGRIVSISSVIGQSGGFGQTNYAAAKAGIIGFTKAAALELAKYNVTVNVIAPGFTGTDMVMAMPEDVLAKVKTKIPLGRLAEPAEVARTVRFLVTDGDYITGQQINVNGGLYM